MFLTFLKLILQSATLQETLWRGFNPDGASRRCWCIVSHSRSLVLMAKECKNEKATMCGCTNHAENLLPAPSRHLFSSSLSISHPLWRFSSKPFQVPYFPTVNCFTSPEPNYGLHTFNLSCLLSSFHIGSTSQWRFDKQIDLKCPLFIELDAYVSWEAALQNQKLSHIEFYSNEHYLKKAEEEKKYIRFQVKKKLLIYLQLFCLFVEVRNSKSRTFRKKLKINNCIYQGTLGKISRLTQVLFQKTTHLSTIKYTLNNNYHLITGTKPPQKQCSISKQSYKNRS